MDHLPVFGCSSVGFHAETTSLFYDKYFMAHLPAPPAQEPFSM